MKKQKDLIIRAMLAGILAAVVIWFGIRPYFDSGRDYGWARHALVQQEGVYDVVVTGGEPESIAAALASSRLGARTLLLCPYKDLADAAAESMMVSLEPNLGSQGELLNKGIFTELYNRLGENFSPQDYGKTVETLVKKEPQLSVVYGAVPVSPVLEGNALTGVTVAIGKETKTYQGKRFIDASPEGDLLAACGVPYFTGSEDLNMKETYQPAALNFQLDHVDWNRASGVFNINNQESYKALLKYETVNTGLRLENPGLTNLGNGVVVVSGLQVLDVDPSEPQEVKARYREAAEEAEYLTAYLKAQFSGFEQAHFSKAADQLTFRESRHFLGEYLLGVNDILENTCFADRVAVGSMPVVADKFTRDDAYVVGKPAQYSVPLRSLVPLKVENVLMAGRKASYASLAASSASSRGVAIEEGEAAGTIAVYTLVRNMTPRTLAREENAQTNEEIQKIFKSQGMEIAPFKVQSPQSGQRAYAALKQLRSLGLIAGGISNQYAFEREATQQDLAASLLNGVYRLDSSKYTLELDTRLRKFFSSKPLDREAASGMLLTLYGQKQSPNAFETACRLGYVDTDMVRQLKSAKTLRLEDIYVLAARNLRLFTGKEIK